MATATHGYVPQTRTEIIDLGTLANATYIASSSIDLADADGKVPSRVTIQAEFNANGTPGSAEQLALFAKWSHDGTTWDSGPESGTTATEEQDLDGFGVVPGNDTNDHRRSFLLVPVQRYMKVVAKNELNVALTSGKVYIVEWVEQTNY